MPSWLENTLFNTQDTQNAASSAAGAERAGISGGAQTYIDAINKATGQSLKSGDEVLQFLQGSGQVPMQARNKALTGLSDITQAGLNRGMRSQDQMIEAARNSPIYASIVGNREQGEEAILRNKSATGGLRSGGANYALYDYNTQLENDALLTSFLEEQRKEDMLRDYTFRGLEGLSRTPTNDREIADVMQSQGDTAAAGIEAAGRVAGDAALATGRSQADEILARQNAANQGRNNTINTVLGGLDMASNLGWIGGGNTAVTASAPVSTAVGAGGYTGALPAATSPAVVNTGAGITSAALPASGATSAVASPAVVNTGAGITSSPLPSSTATTPSAIPGLLETGLGLAATGWILNGAFGAATDEGIGLNQTSSYQIGNQTVTTQMTGNDRNAMAVFDPAIASALASDQSRKPVERAGDLKSYAAATGATKEDFQPILNNYGITWEQLMAVPASKVRVAETPNNQTDGLPSFMTQGF